MAIKLDTRIPDKKKLLIPGSHDEEDLTRQSKSAHLWVRRKDTHSEYQWTDGYGSALFGYTQYRDKAHTQYKVRMHQDVRTLFRIFLLPVLVFTSRVMSTKSTRMPLFAAVRSRVMSTKSTRMPVSAVDLDDMLAAWMPVFAADLLVVLVLRTGITLLC